MPPRRVKCSYREGSRRCPQNGTGSPPLCRPHKIAMMEALRPRRPTEVIAESVVDFLQGRPINKDATIGAVEQVIHQWAAGLGGDYHPDVTTGQREDAVHRQARSGQRPWWHGPGPGAAAREDPQVAADREAQLRARQVMGFAASEPLDEKKVKDVQKRLARRHHPDRGGSVARMAEINNAADVLLASLQ